MGNGIKLTICLLALSACASLGAQSAAQATPEQDSSTPAALTPAANPSAHTALTDSVMESLTNDPVLGSIPLTVKVADNGVVSLNGVVATQSLADQAVAVAKTVPGVQSVQSQILVNEDPFASSAAATSGASLPLSTTAAPTPVLNAASDPLVKVQEAFQANPALARVAINDYGTRLDLNGSVPTKLAEQQAVAIVKQHFPNGEISNTLWVDAHPLASAPKVPR